MIHSLSPEEQLENMLGFFEYDHLPANLQPISSPFRAIARAIAIKAPHEPQTLVALQKLVEAKDAAVRAVVSSAKKQEG